MTSDWGVGLLTALLLFGAYSKLRNAASVSMWASANLGRLGPYVGAKVLAILDCGLAISILLLPTFEARALASLTVGLGMLAYHLRAGARACPCFGGGGALANAAASGAAAVVALLSARDILVIRFPPLHEAAGVCFAATSGLVLFVGAWLATRQSWSAHDDSSVDGPKRSGDLQSISESDKVFDLVLAEQPEGGASVLFGDLRCSSCVTLAKKYAAISALSSAHSFNLDLGRRTKGPARIGMARIIALDRKLKASLGVEVSPSLLILIGTKYELYRGKQECSEALIRLIPG